MIETIATVLARAVRVLRSASAGMLAIRALLALGVVACIALQLPLGSVWLFFLVVMGVAAVLVPDTQAVTGFLVLVVFYWLVRSHHPWPMTAALAAALMLVHWAAVVASTGPVQARLGRRALQGRRWLTWAGVSGVLAALVGVLGWVSSLAGAGLPLVSAASLIVVAGIAAMLVVTRRG